jgi:hypothetical protein
LGYAEEANFSSHFSFVGKTSLPTGDGVHGPLLRAAPA